MYTNIDKEYLLALCTKEPEAQLIFDTMLENHKRIIGTISHEIRNPLTYLYSSLQLMEESHDNLITDKHWLSFKEEVLYMKTLLEQLSSYNNGATLRMDKVDVTELLGSCVLSFASSCVEKDVAITSLIPTLPTAIWDKYKIKQVLINLLKNAVEACDYKGNIQLSASLIDDHIHISIKDNGCGIPQEHLEDIFTPFKTFKQGGTGLGLSVCHEVITAHEGNIEVNSTLNIGTEFIITLPID